MRQNQSSIENICGKCVVIKRKLASVEVILKDTQPLVTFEIDLVVYPVEVLEFNDILGM